MQKRGMTITLTTIRGVLYLQRTHDVRVNTLAHPVKTVADEPNTHAKIHAHLLPHLLETPVQKKCFQRASKALSTLTGLQNELKLSF